MDNTEAINNEEPKVMSAEEYDAEYDKLWDKANDIAPEPEEEKTTTEPEVVTEPTVEAEAKEPEEGSKEPEAEVGSNNELEVEKQKIDDDASMSEQEKEVAKAFLTTKYRGTELSFNKEEASELVSKGIDYTQKTQELAQWRRLIENTKDIPESDINALKALKDGNKDALLQLAKEYNVDLYDLDAEKEPEVPNYLEQGNQPVQEELQRISQRIEADTNTRPKVEQVLDILPQEFKEQMAVNPKLLEGLYLDVKQGVTDNILNEALKSYYVSGGDFLNHYQGAYQKVYSNQTLEPQQVQQVQKAVPPKTTNTAPAKKDYLKDAEEIWNMPNDDFAKLKAKVMSKQSL